MTQCKIFIDRLKGGQTEKIKERLAPEFLGPQEAELRFEKPVDVDGEAYLTGSHLIVHLKTATEVLMPCSVCNQMIPVPLAATNFYHAEPIENLSTSLFDYSEALREALLIELPKIVECNSGKCPERPQLQPFLRKPAPSHFPFSNMDNLKN